MFRVPPKKLKPGDELTTTWLNKLLEFVLSNVIQLGVNSGIAATETPNGIALRVSGNKGGYVGKTTSVITARVGTTPGTGTVELYLNNGSNILTDIGQHVTVYSYSSTSGGIASSTYCFVMQDNSGTWWIISVDCG